MPLRTQLSAGRYSFGHQLASVFVLIVLLVSVPAMFTQLYNTDFAGVMFGDLSPTDLLLEDRAFLRAILYTLLTVLCLSSIGRRGLAPVLTPVNDFIVRYRWQALLLLGLIATYRMSDTVMGVMANVFYIDQGFTKDQIAGVSKIFGLIMTLVGAGMGGLLIVRFGILPILLIGGAASAGTNLLFMLLADMGPNLQMLIVTISLDNFSSGLATSAFVAYLSSLTNLKFSATQYALLSSIMLLLPRLMGGYSGVMVEKFGYHTFFIITAVMGIPTLLLISLHWYQESRRARLNPPSTSKSPVNTRGAYLPAWPVRKQLSPVQCPVISSHQQRHRLTMRTSQYLLATQKETPSDAVVISHQLMLRAGMIRKLASGLYTWLPMGLRIMRKAEAIVREEMNAAGALEVLMPSIQPAELWQESGRWEEYGPELLRLKDRHGREFCVGPTHEEVITDLCRNELNSYKQLPINLYQIQTKFRDEIRPRFGLMRGREFIMKDAYSFHADEASLQVTYDRMHQAYCNVFTRLGLNFRPVEADNGSIGGAGSHEFHVLAESGEDDIVFSNGSSYAANIEKAEAVPTETSRPAPALELRLVDTPDAKTIVQLVEVYDLPIEKTVKTLIVHAAEEGKLIALVIRGDHELNEIKASNHPLVASPLVMAGDAELREAIGAGAGSLGPLNLPLPCIIDRSVELMSDFAVGANIDDKHYFGVNWERDLPVPTVADLRNVVAGDPSPDGKGTLEIKRGIEVGHIFQLGTKYSEAMKCQVLGENGKPVTLSMGCYGIGVSRVVAAAIEQNNDERGIIWSDALAPFQVALVPLRYETEAVREATDALYAQLTAAGFEVLLDDRDKKTSPGIKFADMELIGIPHRIVVSDRGLAEGNLEYKSRTEAEPQALPVADVLAFLQARIRR